MAYLQAVLNNVVNNLPVRYMMQNLKAALQMLSAANALPLVPPPATTLAMAKRKVGIDPDKWIIPYAACPVCWKLHTPEALDALPEPMCSTPDCSGTIYEVTRNAKGKDKRKAVMIIPQVSLLESIWCLVRRKGYWSKLRDSHNGTPANANDDPDFGTVRDVDREDGSGERLANRCFGLHMSVNLDWFGIFENRPHSTGPIYVAINNLPREEWYLQANVICIAITPEPKEPTSKQLNNVLEPITVEACKLKNGVKMEILDDAGTTLVEETVYGDFVCNNCDTPGARKFAGFSSHSSLVHPCPWCRCTLDNVNEPEGYHKDYTMRNDQDILNQKYASKDASGPRQKRILELHGVQWSALDYIPGWMPSKQTALDFMHCIYLGLIAFLFTKVLFAAHLFPGAGGDQSLQKKFERAINSIRWPSHITRLPKNLGENQSLKKADEWRRLLTITPIILWLAWKDGDDCIPDTEPPVSPNEVISMTHSRKRRSLYNTILYLCAGVRLLSIKAILMAQAAKGQTYLRLYCLELLTLGVLLTINHHLAMHFAMMIKLFGPVYAWWLFAFERFNGMLEWVNHNGHNGGRIELTLLRNWVQTHLLYELLLLLPNDAHPGEQALINEIIDKDVERGGMVVEMAIFQAEATLNNIMLPKQLSMKPLDLFQCKLQDNPDPNALYNLFFPYVQSVWPQHCFQRQFGNEGADTIRLIGNQFARRLSYFHKDGLRYGSKSNTRLHADSFVFIQKDHVRIPVSIEDIYALKIAPDGGPQLPVHVCVLVCRLRVLENIAQFNFLWQLYASILGIHVTLADQYELPLKSTAVCPLALIPARVSSRKLDVQICISFDHVATELENPLENDIEGNGGDGE
ncbi:hypothetical protein DFP72DRAFT_986014 [Ephemerocybe angulata]|uniref:Uncharacterized protein n=1 Tax=Ephemerocybe angulata TaxID=980116 RepID=A0A8H6MD61_9AGAR|nr:hypothetical protein DFP72DRAFT_986014 [Tulosesus angulatus]